MTSKKLGGYRPNAGRPKTGRKHAITLRVSDIAFDKLSSVQNKSKCIDELIKRYL